MMPAEFATPSAKEDQNKHCSCNTCYTKVEEGIGKVFARYGMFVSMHPWKFIIIFLIINGLLGIGMLRLKPEIDVQKVYTPINSQASQDSDKVKDAFVDGSGTNFVSFQMTDLGKQADVIIRPYSGNALNNSTLMEFQRLFEYLNATSGTTKDGRTISLQDVCARSRSKCAVDGSLFFLPSFHADFQANALTYPFFTPPGLGPIFYEHLVGDANTNGTHLSAARMLLLRINLRTDTSELREFADIWEEAFLKRIESFQSSLFEIAYSHSNSLSLELDANIGGDITYFSITFTLMITYACLAAYTARHDCVGQKMNLGYAGVLAAGLSIVSGFGITSACGVTFVSIVGVVPFLIIGIGVDNMFVLMAGLNDAPYDKETKYRIADTMKTSGVAITITSLTDVLAFAAGASSTFLSVRNFCIYTGVTVVFCYINQVTFFLACLALNERRTWDKRHNMTCMKVKSREEYEYENEGLENKRSKRYILCCAGSPPLRREEAESFLDRVPGFLIPKLVLPKPMKVIIVVVFAGYLGVSVWGVTKLEQGLVLRNLVSENSYHYKYRQWLEDSFLSQTPISFVINSPVSYSEQTTQNEIKALTQRAQSHKNVIDTFIISWLDAYKNSSFYANASEMQFISGLLQFLIQPQNSRYQNDVAINMANTSILASRVYVLSKDIQSTTEEGQLMLDMRDIASESPLPVFAFSPAFIFFEQYVAILPQTLQTVGVAIGMVFLVTIFFMPHPVLLIFVTLVVAMIIVGTFGFLTFLDLTLSSITMIHLIMCVGFSVDFTAHICHGYMVSIGENRNTRVEATIKRSGAPIFHGAVSSILGIAVLSFAKSFIFQSFFKVMILVLVFGIAHALLFLPVMLSVIGPSSSKIDSRDDSTVSPTNSRGSSIKSKKSGTNVETRNRSVGMNNDYEHRWESLKIAG